MTDFMKKPHDALAEVSSTGKFVRTAAGFRDIISPSHPVYQPQPHRYHLYISFACPWANRCLVMLKWKGLDHVITWSAVHPTWQRTKPHVEGDVHCGWWFHDSSSTHDVVKNSNGYGEIVIDDCQPDPINGVQTIRDLYELSQDTHGKYSVPVLWDKYTKTIVNNESSEIIRMFNVAFQEFAIGPFANHDFYPAHLRSQIEEANNWIYPMINDGVYKCGFAKSQLAYNEAIDQLYDALDRLEDILASNRFVLGTYLTEADIRLFMTLVRFDEVYVVYFKCNVKRLVDYPHIREYMRDMYQLPNMASCINMTHIKTHYFTSHATLNPYAVIPKGPNVLAELQLPHGRKEKFADSK